VRRGDDDSSQILFIVASAALLAALLLLAGLLYEWIGGGVDRRKLMKPGRLVGIGEGRQLYMVERGPRGRGPA